MVFNYSGELFRIEAMEVSSDERYRAVVPSPRGGRGTTCFLSFHIFPLLQCLSFLGDVYWGIWEVFCRAGRFESCLLSTEVVRLGSCFF